MAALHPHQQVYFNALVDTKTPGALAARYDMDYWQAAQLQALEYLLARYPDDTLRVWPRKASELMLPKDDRERIPSFDSPYAADFYLWSGRGYQLPVASLQEAGIHYIHPLIQPHTTPERTPIHSVKAYGSAIAFIFDKDVAAYRAAYDDIAANGDPLARAGFDIYAYDGSLYYISADCPQPISDRDAGLRVFLHITPDDPADLPADRREHGFENLDFWFNEHAAFFDGKCVNRQPLPDYAIARIRTGHKATASGGDGWRADIDIAARAATQATHDRILAGDYGQPVAQSDFDMYLRGNTLAYLKETCAEGDTDARFFLHIIPADLADLPSDRRDAGFANLDFHFTDHGARIGDLCVVTRELPDYPIDRIRTGQFVSGEGAIWRTEFAAER